MHVVWWTALVVCKTLRVRIINHDVIKKLQQQKQNYVLAFWHGTMLLPWYLHRWQKMQALVSLSEDGEILARTLEHWGYDLIRGSSSMGGKEAMQLMSEAVQGGASLCITPDGPRGPRHKMKMGAVRVAQKAQVPLVLLSAHIEKKKVLKNWDRFEIPFPFSKVVAAYSEPIWVNASLDGETLDKFLSEVESTMLGLDSALERDEVLGIRVPSQKSDSLSLQTVVRTMLLFPFSMIYCAIITLRNKFYDWKIFHVHRVSVPVVSVGNITVGGAGKTPLVEYITRYFLDKGKKVAVISRGYKRATRGLVVVSNGDTVWVNSRGSGDEPYQIASKFQKAIVIVDEKRARGARHAVKSFGAEVIILDDGFQHRPLHRDVDIVVAEAHRLPMYTGLLPAGRRREPLRSLNRADLLVVSKLDSSVNFDNIVPEFQRFANAPIIGCRYTPTSFKQAKTNDNVRLDSLQGKTAVAFCGISDSASFYAMLKQLQLQLLHTIDFADHHYYTDADIASIMSKYNQLQANYIVTTEKDYVRLTSDEHFREEFFGKFPLYYLEIEIEIVAGGEILRATLDSILS